jgi:hypothetical protein
MPPEGRLPEFGHWLCSNSQKQHIQNQDKNDLFARIPVFFITFLLQIPDCLLVDLTGWNHIIGQKKYESTALKHKSIKMNLCSESLCSCFLFPAESGSDRHIALTRKSKSFLVLIAQEAMLVHTLLYSLKDRGYVLSQGRRQQTEPTTFSAPFDLIPVCYNHA